VAAFGVGSALALALIWFGATGSAQESSDIVPVCVGTDRVLRFVEVEKNCRAGEQRFILASATVESESEEPEGKKPAKRPDQPAGQGSTEGGGRVTKVTAPFEVVDAQGLTLMRVTDDDGTAYGRGVYVFNNQKRPVAHVGVASGGGGGRILVRDKDANRTRHVQMIYTASGPQFVIKGDNDKMMLSIDKIGLIYYNAQENPAISLGAGQSGAKGVLKIADEDGISAVEAGSLDKRGIVRVYPAKGAIPFPIPQFIMGSKP
jgi:hypothetical protein